MRTKTLREADAAHIATDGENTNKLSEIGARSKFGKRQLAQTTAFLMTSPRCFTVLIHPFTIVDY